MVDAEEQPSTFGRSGFENVRKRENFMAEKQRDRSSDRDHSSGADVERGSVPRTATSMAPGIPTGSGKGIDEALRQPDNEIGGGVAGDTTPATAGGTSRQDDSAGGDAQKREPKAVLTEDRDRTTL